MNILPDSILLIYMFSGIYMSIFNIKIPQWYIVLLYFILFKIIFNYDKCTISYWECKLRRVKKKDGYLYRFLDKFIRLRDTNYRFNYKLITILIFTFLISFFYFSKGGRIYY